MLPIHSQNQPQPGTFGYTIDYLVDNEIGLTVFETRYCNDETGAPAYDPAILLKIILFAYSRGITGSRRIAQACKENVVFMALSADTRPHFTTIAEFISTMSDEIESAIPGLPTSRSTKRRRPTSTAPARRASTSVPRSFISTTKAPLSVQPGSR